jgi:hypothetical protein
MMNNEAQAASIVRLIDPVSAANTAAATSGWIDVRQYEGDLAIIQQIGAVTGSIAGKIQDATDGSGTGVADVAGATFATVSAANNAQEIAVSANAVRGWIRYLGTVTTGPALTAVSMLARSKIV